MNANGLARLYDRLSNWERIPLLIAADARGDDPEYRRLFAASAMRTWHFPEHLMDELALNLLALIYVGEQLDAAATYFFALLGMEKTEYPRAQNLQLVAEGCAYFFVANAEAWRRFCAELDISADTLTAANHKGWFLRLCEEKMPADAPTAEALEARFRESGWEVSCLTTVETLLASWRNVLRAMTGHSALKAATGEP